MGIVVKSPHEIEIMRQAGRILAAIMDVLKKRIEPGIITEELDTITVHELSRHGAESHGIEGNGPASSGLRRPHAYANK